MRRAAIARPSGSSGSTSMRAGNGSGVDDSKAPTRGSAAAAARRSGTHRAQRERSVQQQQHQAIRRTQTSPASPNAPRDAQAHVQRITTAAVRRGGPPQLSEQSESDFDIGLVNAHNTTSSATFRQASEHTNRNRRTVTSFLDEPTESRFTSSGHRAYSTAASRPSNPMPDSDSSNLGSTFLAKRGDRDLREVDQSVNLMAGQFADDDIDSQRSSRSRKGRRKQNKRGSTMMEIFFNDQGDSTKVRRKSMMDIDLGAGPGKQRKSVFGSAMNVGPIREPWWTKFEDCWEDAWGVFKKMLPCLVVVLVVILCSIYAPQVTTWERSSSNSAPRPDEPPTKAPTPSAIETLAPVPVPAESVETMAVVAADAASMVADSEPTTPEDRRDAIVSVIATLGISTPEDLANPVSPASKGIQWLADFDPASLQLASTPEVVLVERFAVAAFFFLAHGDTLPSSLQTTSVATTVVGRRAQYSPIPTPENWMSEKSICVWEGLGCQATTGRLVAFNQTRAGLGGTLPRELASLDQLLELDLSHNSFAGRIPAEWGQGLTNLRYLMLNDNGTFTKTPFRRLLP